MKDDNLLPSELVWEKNGEGEDHLSEIVLTAIADGQAEIVPEVAFTHLQWCESCVSSIGNSAMLSARIGDALHEFGLAVVQAKEPRAAVAPAPLPVPWFAVAAALLLAIVSALPQLAIAPLWIHDSYRTVIHAIPNLVHGVVATVHGGARASLAVSYASAALLMMIGVVFAARQHAGVRMQGQ